MLLAAFIVILLGHQNRIQQLETALRAKETRDAQQARSSSRIRYDQIRVPFEDYGSKTEAHTAVVRKGREAFFGGRLSSDLGWTTVSALSLSDIQSRPVRRAVSGLPKNSLSEILQDESAFYIIRVRDDPAD